MTPDRTYYDALKRRYLAAARDQFKPGCKNKDDVLLEETPSTPSELRQYIEVVDLFSNRTGNDNLNAIYREANLLLESMERRYPGDSDLRQARERLSSVNTQVRKNKRETPIMFIIIISITGLVFASLFLFPGWAAFIKKVFFLEYIRTWILGIFALFT